MFIRDDFPELKGNIYINSYLCIIEIEFYETFYYFTTYLYQNSINVKILENHQILLNIFSVNNVHLSIMTVV